ncbi:histidine phosphatase family protein [Ornithinibacillus sp. L9]|uniref:Histidine phosphatase family protein n=1 Tax=Ornithinibacillus caprae TaxID=2678566 RepID=A0A6N8FF76_9BACI|nr:histidine phosphatase family protein [Ornithinibacillus caprae]MUK88173.1 histidine phosphatase family protein [Ornithinibacillus caprae]
MTLICLVRHGETDWNAEGRVQGKTDIPLNQKGREQAELCGESLNPNDYDVLVTSPLQRAKLTAEIMNNYLELPMIEMEDFAERSFGDGEGLTFEERTRLFPDGNYPNKEDRHSFNQRVMGAVNRVSSMYPGKRVLVVAHGAVINQILHTLSNGEIGSGKTKLLNTCISNIHYQEEKWIIKNYNQIDHLTKKV